MEAIAWVLGVGIFLGLLLAFPKRMGVLIAVLVGLSIVGAGGIFAYNAFEKRQREQIIGNINVVINFDTSECKEDFPLSIGIINGTEQTIQKTSFSIVGLREGHSEPLYKSNYREYSTDLIIDAGEGFGTCWSLPKRAYGISDSIIERHPPEELIWEVTNVHPTFND